MRLRTGLVLVPLAVGLAACGNDHEFEGSLTIETLDPAPSTTRPVVRVTPDPLTGTIGIDAVENEVHNRAAVDFATQDRAFVDEVECRTAGMPLLTGATALCHVYGRDDTLGATLQASYAVHFVDDQGRFTIDRQ